MALGRRRSTSGFNPRPSQPEGATLGGFTNQEPGNVSIHAPPNRKERPKPSKTHRSKDQVSIHAPPNRKERLAPGRVPGSYELVSIHAPPNRKERP